MQLSSAVRKRQQQAASLLVLVACSVLAGPAAAAAASADGGSSRAGRKLKQVTLFYDTPAAAGSTSVGLNANAALRPDGTVHAATGASVTSSTGIANPLPYWLTLGAYNNRPEAGTTAYTQIPLLLQQTLFPTLSYGRASAKGDTFSTSGGTWGNLEFGYNPFSNNLGTSISSGTANTINVASSETVDEINPGAGLSQVEFAGYSNDLTNLADSRTDQSGQAIAQPYNIFSPVNPLTCTQSLLYAVTLTSYDLGAPAGPLPRENPATIVPFCLGLFNFGTLDDFSAFVDENNDYELFFDNNRDGKIEGLRALYPDGQVFNTPGTANTNAPDTVSASQLSAGGDAVQFAAENRNANAAAPGAAAAAAGGGSPRFNLGGRGAQRAAANPVKEPGMRNAQQMARLQERLKTITFKEAVGKYLKAAPPEVQIFAATPIGQKMFDRLSDGAVARMADETAKMVANITDTAVSRMAQPIDQVVKAASNLTSSVAMNVTNLALKSAAAGISALKPAIGAVALTEKNLVQPMAEASRDAAASFAEKSAAALQETIAKLPEGDLKKQAEQAAATLAKGAAAQPQGSSSSSSSSSNAAQMGRRRMLH
uniref:Uncharacterized protein n=1 Tax=Tetradesmus obliquus TaxID=3088 RepID=A0A383VL49_TETOB|eukprot:jgi/Sobl393_1/15542/SZX65462.1